MKKWILVLGILFVVLVLISGDIAVAEWIKTKTCERLNGGTE